MAKKTIQSKYLLPAIFVLIFVSIGLFHFFSQQWAYYKNIQLAKESGCFLDYGVHECIDGEIVVPFHNSSMKTITFASLTVPVKTGQNIYRVEEPLESESSATITASACSELSGHAFFLKWCCKEECFETIMDSPNKDIQLIRQ